jgi:GT2 family glycosyltransferase
VIVSYNAAAYLEPCLSSVFARAGTAVLDVVVVDNASTDGSADLVERRFPQVRVLRGENHGFAYGNNRGLELVDAPFVLFLNPDTEILTGTFGELVEAMRARPALGLAGCRQVTPDGTLHPTIRRFPRADRMFWEALGSERFPFRASWLGERELDPAAYDRETPCDWTSGSFMLARRGAVIEAGMMDERFFIYCEEPDLCLRIKRSGWDVCHLPAMTILHHAGKDGDDPRLVAQDSYARRQYFDKHFRHPHRELAIGARALYHARRAATTRRRRTPQQGARRVSSLHGLRTVLGLAPPPFGERIDRVAGDT